MRSVAAPDVNDFNKLLQRSPTRTGEMRKLYSPMIVVTTWIYSITVDNPAKNDNSGVLREELVSFFASVHDESRMTSLTDYPYCQLKGGFQLR